jgi:tetratricopeptide (TPR) repeat protein
MITFAFFKAFTTMRIVRNILLFAMLFRVAFAYGQYGHTLDSLLNILRIQEEDTAKTAVYYEITKRLITEDIDSAQYYANKGLFLALNNDQKNYTGKFYSAIGDIYVLKNDLNQALENYLNTIPYYEEAGNLTGICLVDLVIGNIYLSQGNYLVALRHYRKGLAIADSLKLERLLPHYYNNLGEINLDLENYESSIENYKKALELFRANGNYVGMAAILNNIGKVHIEMGQIDKAEEYLDESFEIYDSISNNLGLKKIFTTKGDIQLLKGNYDQALMNYREAYNYLEKVGSEYFGPKSSHYAEAYNNLGYAYLKLKKYDLAKENLLKAEEIATETGLPEVLADITLNLSELYETINNPKRALSYYKLYKMYSDSISNEQNLKKITQLEMQYKFDKLLKEKEVEQLKYKERQKRKEIFYLLVIVGVAAMLIVLGLLFNLQRLKRKNLLLEKENLERDLNYKNKELTTNALYLLKKNEFIINLSNELKNLRYSFKPENRKVIDRIIRDMEQTTSEDVWKEFEIRFQEVHTDFYNKLAEKHPDLSPNELRLCAFLRLNMSTKEISSITFQSYNSIIMARHRLRKKLNMDSNDNLIAFLRQL